MMIIELVWCNCVYVHWAWVIGICWVWL